MENISEEQQVLIVDDEPANIRILIETLKGRYKLIGAICGRSALSFSVPALTKASPASCSLPSREAGASPASAFPSRGLGTREHTFFSFPSPCLGTREHTFSRSQAPAWERGNTLFSRSQAPAWERVCARSPGFVQSPVTGSRGFPGKCVPKPGLGNEKNKACFNNEQTAFAA